MKRMYSKNELLLLIASAWPQIVGALKGHDIEVDGITSKGIANTGSFGNIGDGVFSGNLYVQEDVGGGEDGNLDVEGEITANTIKQASANSSVDFASITPSTLTENLQYIPKYCRLEEINGVLHLVWNFAIKNETENNIQINWLRLNMTLPTEIADKIYDFNNKKVSEAISYAPITSFSVFTGSQAYPSSMATASVGQITNREETNSCQLSVYIAQTVASNTEILCSGRVALTLI